MCEGIIVAPTKAYIERSDLISICRWYIDMHGNIKSKETVEV